MQWWQCVTILNSGDGGGSVCVTLLLMIYFVFSVCKQFGSISTGGDLTIVVCLFDEEK